MSRQRFIALIVAAVLAISGALYLSAQRNLRRDAHGAALVPTLAPMWRSCVNCCWP